MASRFTVLHDNGKYSIEQDNANQVTPYCVMVRTCFGKQQVSKWYMSKSACERKYKDLITRNPY